MAIPFGVYCNLGVSAAVVEGAAQAMGCSGQRFLPVRNISIILMYGETMVMVCRERKPTRRRCCRTGDTGCWESRRLVRELLPKIERRLGCDLGELRNETRRWCDLGALRVVGGWYGHR